MAPRAFISFEMEDRWARDFLVRHAHDNRNDIDFVDFSVQDPFDSGWKTKAKERIGQTTGTIVLIGPTTHRSEAVLWEVAETVRQGHLMFGVQTRREATYPIPQGLSRADVIPWDFDLISRRLGSWS
jgi:hypothetical protein